MIWKPSMGYTLSETNLSREGTQRTADEQREFLNLFLQKRENQRPDAAFRGFVEVPESPWRI